LRTLLYFNRYKVVVLTDYKSIRGIVHYSILNITSIDQANCRLINASVYLSIYQLDMYYIPGCLNFMPDVFSRLRILGDDVVCKDDAELVLDVF